ncbi:MAG: hypothetical protein AB7O88_23265 [Reyranellaceae bacterium]
MPLTWRLDQARRLIVATLTGPLAGADIQHWIDERRRTGVTGYRLIFDASSAELELHPAEMTALSRIAAEHKPEGFDGALALIASSEAERDLGAYFARRTNSERPCRVFATVEAAYSWFAELDAAAPR